MYLLVKKFCFMLTKAENKKNAFFNKILVALRTNIHFNTCIAI